MGLKYKEKEIKRDYKGELSHRVCQAVEGIWYSKGLAVDEQAIYSRSFFARKLCFLHLAKVDLDIHGWLLKEDIVST